MPTLSFAQTANDIFACAQPGITFDELQGRFSSLGWDAAKPDRSDIFRQVIFLGNVDALEPATWPATADLARDLANHQTDKPHSVFALDGTAVLLERQNDSTVSCLFVSDKQMSSIFQEQFPQLTLRQFGQRSFGWFDQPDLQASVAFLERNADELASLSEGRRSSASIINKTASAKED